MNIQEKLDNFVTNIPIHGINFPQLRKELKQLIKDWLTEERQELNPNYSGMMADYREDIAECAQADLLDKLIESLCVDSSKGDK